MGHFLIASRYTVPVRILFTRFPLESAHGGAEVQTLALMRGLREKKHEVVFAGSCPVLLKECRKDKFKVIELDVGPPPVSVSLVLSFALRKAHMQARLSGLIKGSAKYDAVCMLSLSEKILLTPLCIEKGIPVFWIEHDRIGRWLTKNPWLKQLKVLSQQVKTITVSDLSKKLYEELGFRPSTVVAIPNGIDETRLDGKHVRLKAKSAQLRVGCIARLSPEKGIDLLIRAIKDVPEGTLEIVGRGSEEPLLKRLTRQRDLQDRVTFTTDFVDLAQVYARWDVLVLPSSEHDPFGLVAGEAMIVGLPVVVTDACGIADYLHDDDDALIVPANSSSALAHALLALRDPLTRERIAQAGQATAKEKFSMKKMVAAYAKVLGS